MVNYKQRPSFFFISICLETNFTYHNYLADDMYLLIVKNNDMLKYKGHFGRSERIKEILK